MRIEILRQTSIQGRPILAGEVVEATDRDARYLVAKGKAQLAQDPIPAINTVSEARKPRPRKPTPL